MPIFCGALLKIGSKDIRAGRSTPWTMASQPLHFEYRPEVYPWEVLSLAQRLLVTGYASLIPNHLGVIRLLCALYVTIAFMLLLVIVQPYKRFDLNALAVASFMIQTSVFLTAVRGSYAAQHTFRCPPALIRTACDSLLHAFGHACGCYGSS